MSKIQFCYARMTPKLDCEQSLSFPNVFRARAIERRAAKNLSSFFHLICIIIHFRSRQRSEEKRPTARSLRQNGSSRLRYKPNLFCFRLFNTSICEDAVESNLISWLSFLDHGQTRWVYNSSLGEAGGRLSPGGIMFFVEFTVRCSLLRRQLLGLRGLGKKRGKIAGTGNSRSSTRLSHLFFPPYQSLTLPYI